MAREIIFFQIEGSYKVPVTCTAAEVWSIGGTPTAGFGVAGYGGFFGRLTGGDSFTMRPRSVPVNIPYGGGLAITANTVSDKLVCDGQFTTTLFSGPYSQFLLTWAAQQVNTAGYVAPVGTVTGWQSTEAPGNLASVSIYHAIQLQPSGTYKCRVYRGCKVKSFAFTISQESQIASLTMQLTGSVAQGNAFDSSVDPTLTVIGTAPAYTVPPLASTFPFPSTANLPITPYLFINASNTGGSGSAGELQIGSGAATPRTTFQSVGLSFENVLMTRMWANRFVQFSQFCGRSVKLTAENFYTNVPDDRTAYEALTPQTINFKLGNSVSSVLFTLNAYNILTAFDDSLPLDDIYIQKLTATSQWDPAAAGADPYLAADFQMAFTG